MEKDVRLEDILEPGYGTITLPNGETLLTDAVISINKLYEAWGQA